MSPQSRQAQQAKRVLPIFLRGKKAVGSLVAFFGAVIGVYVAWSNSIPEIHLATPVERAPVEYAFYVRENSPIFSADISQFGCIILDYEDINKNHISNIQAWNNYSAVIGGNNAQIFYRCPNHLGIPVTHLRTHVIVKYRIRFLGIDLFPWSVTSPMFHWPASPTMPQWSEGESVN